MSREIERYLDTQINRLCEIRNKISQHFDTDFDIKHLLPVVSASIDALSEEVESELKDI